MSSKPIRVGIIGTGGWVRYCHIPVLQSLKEVMSDTPGVSASCRSSGVATDVAITSALAPGRLADPWIVAVPPVAAPRAA